jgi:hypothetical protein
MKSTTMHNDYHAKSAIFALAGRVPVAVAEAAIFGRNILKS